MDTSFVTFETRDGVKKRGNIIRIYSAFEGDLRYIIRSNNMSEYRCVCIDGKYKELTI